ncbi:MAG: hypothetical protein HYY24_13570 [Verrucomicrobia bacterium]|nr:hypothetical protein [Verrucomicrobiota bacterium]
MRARGVLWLSLGLNGALAAAWFLATRRPATFNPPPTPAEVLAAATTAVKTNVIVRRQNITWEMLESEDYPVYIANLRAIGCPESTIRDIIVADVNELYADRRAKEIILPAHQWWRSDPDPAVVAAARETAEALDEERRELLTRLLGPEWDIEAKRAADAWASLAESTLSGRLLGDLSPESKKAVLGIIADSQRRYREKFEDKPVDPVEWARIRKETREQLARVLTAEQLEEYLLRYSENADTLREQMRGLDLSPEEFRKVFRLTDAIDQDIQLSDDAAASAQRRKKELEQQRDAAIESELGTDRARMYKLNQEPLFRQARAAVEQLGAEPEAVLPLYKIYQEAERETKRIQADATLTAEEREEQLHLIQLDQQRSVRKIQETFKRSERAETTPPEGTP